MKLRNKKTGEIGELQITAKHYAVVVGNGTASCNAKIYCFLDKLNAEWEDYEEPKEYWCIDWTGGVNHITLLDDSTDKYEKAKKQIGNYFLSEEEAKKAVEKLKAWKRLKDKGFRFEGRDKPNYGEKFIIECSLPKETLVIDVVEDLDLLFGGEE